MQRGTEIRNERQLSIVASDELAVVANRMGLAELKPEWIGANLVLEGLPNLSMLPAGTLLFFKGGVTLKVDGQNKPCRYAGRSIAENAAHAGPGGRRAALSEIGEAPARPCRLGREARPHRAGRGDFRARAGAVDLHCLKTARGRAT